MESTPLARAPALPARLSGTKSPSAATLRRALAIAEAVFSRNGAAPDASRLAWLETELEDFLARAGARSRAMLAFSFWVVSFAAPLCAARLARLSSLAIPERVAALAALERALPEPLLAVKALLCLVYYEHPDAAAEVGVRAPHLIALRAGAVRPAPGGRP